MPPAAPRDPVPDGGDDRTGDPLRAPRRWVVAAVVAALVAVGLAVFALFTGDIDDREDAASARDVSQLSERVDAVEDQLRSATDAQDEQAAEVSRLSAQLDELDRTLADVRSAARQPSEELDSIETRVEDIEDRLDQVDSSADRGGGPDSNP